MRLVVGKHEVLWNTDDGSALDFHIAKYGIFGDWVCRNFESIVRPDDVIFDVGANAGYISIPIAKAFPKTVTYAFEPDDEMFQRLRDNIRSNNLENVVALPVALQDDQLSEGGSLHIRRAVDGNGKNNAGLSSIENLKSYTVKDQACKFSTVDKIVKEYGIDRLDFMKLDVEGAEGRVIAGGFSAIKKCSPVILFENSPVLDGMLGKQNTRETFELLKDAGYGLFFEIFDEKELRKIDRESSHDCNVLAVPRNREGLFA
jgi:FkbM family methyltransferase